MFPPVDSEVAPLLHALSFLAGIKGQKPFVARVIEISSREPRRVVLADSA